MEPQEKTKIPDKLKPFFDKVITHRENASIVEYRKECEPKKTFVKKYGEIGKIEKVSKFQVFAGNDYVSEGGSESGERERKEFPESMEKIDIGIYHHKYKDTWYLGCQLVDNPNSIKSTKFYVDAKEKKLNDIIIEGQTLKDILYAKDIENHDSSWIYLSVENITGLSSI